MIRRLLAWLGRFAAEIEYLRTSRHPYSAPQMEQLCRYRSTCAVRCRAECAMFTVGKGDERPWLA